MGASHPRGGHRARVGDQAPRSARAVQHSRTARPDGFAESSPSMGSGGSSPRSLAGLGQTLCRELRPRPGAGDVWLGDSAFPPPPLGVPFGPRGSGLIDAALLGSAPVCLLALDRLSVGTRCRRRGTRGGVADRALDVRPAYFSWQLSRALIPLTLARLYWGHPRGGASGSARGATGPGRQSGVSR